MAYQVIFFGSFGDFSVSVLDRLHQDKNYEMSAVVTTAPAPKGRHLHLSKNETQDYSEKHNIRCYPLKTLSQIPSELVQNRPDFIVVAGYGQLIPKSWLDLPKIMSINMHPSLLPDYPGRCPAEWAILNGESETGVTIIQMNEKFDTGPILAQEKIPIDPDDTRLTLYTKLFDLGARMLIKQLPKIAQGDIRHKSQITNLKSNFYARQITRQDGFIPWDEFNNQITNHKSQISTKHRAFAGWPGVWTTNSEGKRIKLIAQKPQVLIQEEGQNPKPWQV